MDRLVSGTGRRAGLVLILVGLALWGPAAEAQWVEPPGRGWVQLSLSHHDTRNRFDERQRIRPLFNEGGRSITTSLFVTAVAGVVRGMDMWLEVPVHSLQFNDDVVDRHSAGLGDPRVHLRVSPALLGVASPVPVAVRVGVKWPVGAFPVDAEIVPLTEGQRDVEVLLEVGRSFYPQPVYAMAWAGYRWRALNPDAARKPGNERFFFAAVGGQYRAVTWKVAAEGLFGETPRLLGLPILTARRRLVQVLPSVGYSVGEGVVELGVRMPLAGQNLPAGIAFTVGYFRRWKGW